ncbi:MAG TPA: alanine racemase [Methylomirabilota bacterium]|nr:alanine racemase [Methylomirabilota bacterium]
MMPRPTTLEIDLGAAGANVRAVRRLVGPARKIFAVVKADGYGHGAAEMGAAFVENGADALGVADLGEGLRLRRRGITAPILVYPNSLPDAAPVTMAHGLTPTLVDLDGARAYSEAATTPCDVFVKVDVGLERLGVPAEQAVKVIAAMMELPRLRLAGLCAHPHDAEGRDPAYAEWQLGRFTTVVDELEARGIPVPVRLFAASPFLLKFPQTYLNAVDPGRMLYGITFPGEASPVPLAPTFRALTSRIITVKELVPRERFADKAPFPVTAPMRLGVIPMGSAAGSTGSMPAACSSAAAPCPSCLRRRSSTRGSTSPRCRKPRSGTRWSSSAARVRARSPWPKWRSGTALACTMWPLPWDRA